MVCNGMYVWMYVCMYVCMVMLCSVILSYLMLCYVMLSYLISCCVILCYVVLCCVMLCYVMLCMHACMHVCMYVCMCLRIENRPHETALEVSLKVLQPPAIPHHVSEVLWGVHEVPKGYLYAHYRSHRLHGVPRRLGRWSGECSRINCTGDKDYFGPFDGWRIFLTNQSLNPPKNDPHLYGAPSNESSFSMALRDLWMWFFWGTGFLWHQSWLEVE